MKRVLLLFFVFTLVQVAKAQQGFGTNNPAPSSVVDMTAANKGVLLPRVALTSTIVAAPVTAPANSLTVFNTATAGDVTPGYYYWSVAQTKWIRLSDANSPTTDWALLGNLGTSPSTNFLGTLDDQDMVFKVNNATKFIMPKTTNVNLLTAATPSLIDSYLSSPLPIYFGGFTTFNTTHNIYSFSETGSSWGWNGAAASGTPSAPGIPIANALMSTTNGLMYDGTTFVNAARMRMHADGTPTASSLPSKITFWTTPTGSKTNFERLTIKNDGGIGIGVSAPAVSSILDVTSNNRGVLLPRVSLTSTIVAAPVTAPADALTVFNIATAGDVTPGYYYWSTAETKWVRLLTSFSADVRRIGTSHISEDAGVGSNGTTMPGNHNIAIGAGAMNSVSVGPSPFGLLGNIAIGGGDQLAKVTGPSNIAIGYGNNPNGTGGGNIGIGGLNLTSVTTGEGNYAIGIESQQAVTIGAQNISLGAGVLKASTGNKNMGIGNDVLKVLATGNDNVGFGVASGSVLTAGSFNTFFGTEAGNRILGPATDRYTSGDFSLFLGSQTKAQNAVSNQLNIQNYIYGVNGSLAFGDFTGGNALIIPTARLDVTQGNVRIRDINAAYTLLGTDNLVVATNTGILKSVPSSIITSNARNGLTKHSTTGHIELGGDLNRATTISTTISGTTYPLNITGLPVGTKDDYVLLNGFGSGQLKTLPTSEISIEPWQIQGGTLKATANTDAIYQNGSVAIGIASGTSIPAAIVTAHNPKLYVEGNVAITGAFYTTSSVYADYVFEKYFGGKSDINPSYEFKSLNYVRDFIKANNHLPGVTSIAGLNKSSNGYAFDITKLTVQSLEKIEELYLHTIEQKDQIDQQQKEINDLKRISEETNKRIEKLEKLIFEKK